MEEKKILLKDVLFNKKSVSYFSDLLINKCPNFNKEEFEKKVLKKFPELELKERIFWMTEVLENFLIFGFEKNLEIILKSLPSELDSERKDGDFGNFILAPFQYYISKHGLEKKYLKKSFNALAELTKRFSVEDSIRFFINKFPKESFLFMKKMSISKNYHERRLSSEGLRPKLPWCIGIDFNYKKSIEILNNLYYDESRFVVRSVANHLNDISKFDPDFVVNVLKKWKNEKKKNTMEFEYLKQHALRTSIKKGHKKTLNFLGFSSDLKIKINKFLIKNKKINLGEYLEFSFEIFSEKRENLIIDYKIIYPMKNSKKSEKIFKIKKKWIEKNKSFLVEKKHLFKKMTTKKLYSGKYFLQIQINGKIFKEKNFFLNIE